MSNPAQGHAKRVLCVCSAGLLRSPTAAWLLSNPPYNFNTRAAGLDSDHALIVVDKVLVRWADEIVCMTNDHENMLRDRFSDDLDDKEIITLNVPDVFNRMDPRLIQEIKVTYDAIVKAGELENG